MKRFLLIGLLRLLTGLAQFSAVMLLAASLSLESLGTYSLLAIFLTYAVQLGGLNFYTYTLREQAVVGRDGWPAILQRQFVFLAASTLTFCVLIIALQGLRIVQLPALEWFLPLVVLTVFNTQHENFLVGAGWPVAAALNLFIRTCWVYGLAVVNIMAPDLITLGSVLSAWTLSELVGAAFILAILMRRRLLPLRWFGLDLKWLKSGLGVGLGYTALGLLLIVSFSIQRVVLAGVEGDAAVGVFHFFFVVSVFGPNLLEASLFAILLPKLVARARAEGGATLPFPEILPFTVLGLLGACGLVVLYFLMPFLIEMLGKQELAQYMGVLPITAMYAMLYTIARIFHYNLYAANADRWLLMVNAVTCATACVTSLVLVMAFGINGAAWALLATGATLLIGNSLPFISHTARKIALHRS